jgi:hypothetical protein
LDQPAIAGESIKPGVKRSVTPGNDQEKIAKPAIAGDGVLTFNMNELVENVAWVALHPLRGLDGFSSV